MQGSSQRERRQRPSISTGRNTTSRYPSYHYTHWWKIHCNREPIITQRWTPSVGTKTVPLEYDIVWQITYYETATSKEVGRKQGRCQVLGGPGLLLGTEILNTIKESRKSHAWREVKISPLFEDSTVIGGFLDTRLLPCILVYLCGCLAVMIQ